MKHIRFRQLFAVTVLLSAVHAQATIQRISRLAEILPYCSNTTLAIFDLDDTLIRGTITEATDDWFSRNYSTLKQQGLDEQEILDRTLPIYFEAQEKTSVILMDYQIPYVMQQLHAKNVTTLGLTSRSVPLATVTPHQLASVAIDLESPWSESFVFEGTQFPALFESGILFSSSNNKGMILAQFLGHVDYKPHSIVFVDDKLKNIKAVEAAAHEMGIEFVGFQFVPDPENFGE